MTEPAPPLPLPQRVLFTFVDPRRLLNTLRAHAPWAGALVLSTTVAAVVVALQPDAFFLQGVDGAVNRLGEPVTVTSPPSDVARWNRYLAVFSAVVAHPTVALALAGLLMLGFSVLGGGSASFRQYFAASSHALLIPAAGDLLTLPVEALRTDAAARLPLSALLPIAPGTAPHALLSALDVFTIWMLVVLALAVAVFNRRFSWPSAATALIGAYVALAATLALLST